MSVEPVSWRAVQHIATQLRVITRAGGYHTDAGLSVSVEPTQSAATTAPRLVVGMTRVQRSDLAAGVRLHSLSLTVEGLVPATSADAQLQAHRLLADLLRVFPPVSATTVLAPGLQIEVRAESGQVLDQQPGLAVVVASLTLTALVRDQT